jgi:hypothetical protein
MGTRHVPTSRSLAGASTSAVRAGRPLLPAEAAHPACDVLSDVLRAIKLTGALFFVVDSSTPWSVEVPEASAFASLILPGAQSIVSYHVITLGAGWISVGDSPPVAFESGDILVIPHQDRYAMRSNPNERSGLNEGQALDFFRAMAAGQLPGVVKEGGGGSETTKYICGFLGCETRPFNPLLNALPRLVTVRRARSSGPDLLDRLIELTRQRAPAAERADVRRGHPPASRGPGTGGDGMARRAEASCSGSRARAAAR